MSRIPAIDPASAQGKTKDLLDGVQKSLGVTPNLYRVVGQSPAALEGLLSLTGALSHAKLGPKTREAVALAVAQTNACDYCLSAHTLLGKGAGLGADDIAKARDGRGTDAKTDAVIGFARSLVQSQGHATDAELAALRQAGLSEGEIVETVALTVLNIFTNYMNHVAETDIDFPVVRAASL
ncbi:MAG TPA: carboxymuconolactone decarboxylase family protein [Aliidongia sp.]|nr:carboxymuconolactone decarboxylase family protein [Aliidongia sp.]